MKIFTFILENELFKYFLVSLFSLAIDLGIFSFSLRVLHLTWMQSGSVGFLFGLISAYLLSILFVFSKRRIKQRPFVEFFVFSSIGVFGLIVTQISLFIGIEWLKIIPEIAKILAAGITFVSNFFLRKQILFNKP